jgi:hypothetical protein
MALELYDHETDREENFNIARQHPHIADSLVRLLKTVQYMEDSAPFQTGWE